MKNIIKISFIMLGLSMAQHGDDKPLSEHLIPFSQYLGKMFSGEFINSTADRPMRDLLSWERALNGNAVKMVHSVNDGEYGGETLIMWDDEKGSLMSWYFTTAGSLTISQAVIKGEQFISIEDVGANQNGITKVKTIIQLLHGQRLQKKTKYLMNNIWVDGNDMIYDEVKDKRPMFK